MPKSIEKFNQSSVKKFWNVAEIGTDAAEITLYGEIVPQHPIDWFTGEKSELLYISPEGFMEDLGKIKGKSRLTIRINSVGGDLYTGMAIYTQLKCLTAHKTVIIDGIAASAASLIAMAGDTIQIAAGGTMVIHDPLSQMRGYYNKSSIEQVTNVLDKLASAAAETYACKTKMSIDEIRRLMTAETWLTGREAVEMGFADELLFDEPKINLNADKTMLLSNGIQMSISGLNNIPAKLNSIPADAMPPKIKVEGAQSKMETLEEIKKAYPELAAQLISEGTTLGITNERARLQEIENIQAVIGATKLVSEAKYGENPCTAQELAFKAMQEQIKLGKDFITDFKNDVEASGTNSVMSAPNSGIKPANGAVNDENKAQNEAIAMIVGGEKHE